MDIIKALITESFKQVGQFRVDFESSAVYGEFERASPGIKNKLKAALKATKVDPMSDEGKKLSGFLDGSYSRSIVIDIDGTQAAIRMVGGNIQIASPNKIEFEKKLNSL